MDNREIGVFDRGVVKAKETIDGIYDFFANLTNFHREMDIEEAAAFYTKDIDSFIRISEQKSGNSYVAGNLIFQYVNAEIFLLLLDLYFQDASGKWVKQRSQTTRQLKFLKPTAAQELREKREISFEVDPPEESAETKQPNAVHPAATDAKEASAHLHAPAAPQPEPKAAVQNAVPMEPLSAASAEDAPKEAVLAEQETAVPADDVAHLPESAEGMQSSPLPVPDEKKETSAHLHAPAAPQPEPQAAVQNAVPMEPLSAASAEDAPKEAVLAEQEAVQADNAAPLPERTEGVQSSPLPVSDEKRA